jgi:hypothetical protein
MSHVPRFANLCSIVALRPTATSRLAVLTLLLVGLSAFTTCSRETSVAPSTVEWPQGERIDIVRQQLHAAGSGAQARALFPDLKLTYVDDGRGKPYPKQILPFRYYWSPSGRVTITICSVDRTVFICPYYLENVPGDLHSCDVAEIYTEPDHVPPVDK